MGCHTRSVISSVGCPCLAFSLPPLPPLSLQEDYKFYGVFDGHCGSRAAKFASRALHLNLELFLNAVQESPPPPRGHGRTPPPSGHWRNASIEQAVRAAFRKTQKDFLDTVQPSGGGATGRGGGPLSEGATPPQPTPSLSSAGDEGVGFPEPGSEEGRLGASDDRAGGESSVAGAVAAAAGSAMVSSEDDSGTTATVALVYSDVTVVANVGDSRAVLCCGDDGRAVEITEGETRLPGEVERAVSGQHASPAYATWGAFPPPFPWPFSYRAARNPTAVVRRLPTRVR